MIKKLLPGIIGAAVLAAAAATTVVALAFALYALLLPQLDAFHLGALCALYEHRIWRHALGQDSRVRQ